MTKESSQMPASDPTELLLVTNEWANRNIIDAARQLDDEQWHRTFEIGPGSLHDTILHILSAMRGWGNLLAGREQQPPLAGRYTIDELGRMHDTLAADFANSARRHPLHEVVSGERGGRTFSFTRGAVITHVTTHGMHHRAQCLNMLRQLGVKQPQSAVIEWVLTETGQAVANRDG
jgi:uncharacterized damage-inducible protein DinB